jgi:hypothetical protein
MSVVQWTQKWGMLLVMFAVASIFMFVGVVSWRKVLDSNACSMTYSRRDVPPEVTLCGKECDHKLWKMSNMKSKKLNPQPVLFVHGHMGRYIPQLKISRFSTFLLICLFSSL